MLEEESPDPAETLVLGVHPQTRQVTGPGVAWAWGWVAVRMVRLGGSNGTGVFENDRAA